MRRIIFSLTTYRIGRVGMEDWRSRITVDPKILTGKPIIKGTRIAVEFILDLLANGWTVDDILRNYPQLKREDVIAALKYAAEVLKEERVYPLP
jgi:uncharacterized protein (DUF433 family)